MISERGWDVGDFEESHALGCQFPRQIMKTEMSSFQPHLISNFPGYESAGRSQGHEFPSRLVCGKGFPLSFIEGGESVFKGWKESFTERGIGARFISVEDGEWRLLGGAMWCGVMVEFSG